MNKGMLLNCNFKNVNYSIKFWDGEKLGMYVAFDTETTVMPFTTTPDMVTLQAFDGASTVYYVSKDKVWSFFEMHKDAHFIAHNAAFDMDVICKVVGDRTFFHSWIEAHRLWDTNILYKLVHLAEIGWVPYKSSLDLITKLLLGVEIEKDDEIRLEFGQFLNTEISAIPKPFLIYGAIDAIATYQCFHILFNRCKATGSTTALSHNIQIAGSLALNRIYKRGIGFDLERASTILTGLNASLSANAETLSMYGWVRGQKGIKDRYEYIVRDFLKLDLPLTEDGSISSKTEDLLPYTGNHFVDAYIEYSEIEKATTFIRNLK